MTSRCARQPLATALALVLCLAVSVGCGSGANSTSSSAAGPGAVGPSTAGGSPPASVLSPRPSTPGRATSTPTASSFPSSLPGLAGWTVITPQAVDIAVDGGSIRLTLTRRALWFQGQRGVLVGQPVTGDFRISAIVRATDRAGVPLVDRHDGLVELGGLMARADNAARENYVFIVVGTDPNGLSVETKSTLDSASRFEGPAWPSATADLRLCRRDAEFTAWKRPAQGTDAWELAATFDRPDLPKTLLVGPNVYASDQPDLVVTFSHLSIEPLAAGSDCRAG